MFAVLCAATLCQTCSSQHRRRFGRLDDGDALFQTVLICGYLYAHLLTRFLTGPVQIAVHGALWASALFFLPLAVPAEWTFDPQGSISLQTLALFAVALGLPFGVLSANAPLLQAWYLRTGGPSATDPYFLYGASNLGSLIALLSFPLLAEPLFGARSISLGWAVGFVALGIGLLVCGVMALRGRSDNIDVRVAGTDEASTSPGIGDYAYWLFLAFVPSSLMLAVTSRITQDVGSFTLIWILPLALYLLTFVLTFTTRSFLRPEFLKYTSLLALGVIVLMSALGSGGVVGWTSMLAYLAAFFAIALFAHQNLYLARPAGRHLTQFYLAMSVGGALGGVFNSLLAPVIFSTLTELPVTAALAACLYVTSLREISGALVFRGLAAAALSLLPVFMLDLNHSSGWTVAICVLAFIVALSPNRTVTVAVAVPAFLTVAVLVPHNETVFQDRSFFGTHRVTDGENLRAYFNGTTLHGSQRLSELTARPTPMAYYHPVGAMGQVFRATEGQRARRVAIVGLGVGALTCFRAPEEKWDLYEIDRVVDKVARNSALFTFMSECAGDSPTHLGDARIVLETQDGKEFDIIVLDAYSSDAVPVHLMTIEAVEMYLRRLSHNGILMFHISNRYYDLSNPLADIARELGLTARIQDYGDGETVAEGATPSRVVVMAASEGRLEDLAPKPVWRSLEAPGEPMWTDDYANLFAALYGWRAWRDGG